MWCNVNRMPGEMKIQLRQISRSASEAVINSHHIAIDRPIAKGGSGAGPMGGQLFLAAVGGCFMSTLLAAIAAREADISHVAIEVIGSLADAPVRFTGIELIVTAKTTHHATLAHLLEIAGRGCIMMNTLRATLDLNVRALTQIA